MPQPLYPRERAPTTHCNMWLGGPHSQAGHSEEKSLSPARILILDHPPLSQATTLTTLSQLQIYKNVHI
jgi:hypothetical protein